MRDFIDHSWGRADEAAERGNARAHVPSPGFPAERTHIPNQQISFPRLSDKHVGACQFRWCLHGPSAVPQLSRANTDKGLYRRPLPLRAQQQWSDRSLCLICCRRSHSRTKLWWWRCSNGFSFKSQRGNAPCCSCKMPMDWHSLAVFHNLQEWGIQALPVNESCRFVPHPDADGQLSSLISRTRSQNQPLWT